MHIELATEYVLKEKVRKRKEKGVANTLSILVIITISIDKVLFPASVYYS